MTRVQPNRADESRPMKAVATKPRSAKSNSGNTAPRARVSAGAGPASEPVGGRLGSLSRTLSRRVDAVTATYDLSADHWYALDVIVRHDGVAMNDLARTLGVPAPTLTKFVDRLVTLAFAFRLADPGDRRRVLVHASSRGVSARDALAGLVIEAEEEVLGLFGARDRQSLGRMLSRYGSEIETSNAG